MSFCSLASPILTIHYSPFVLHFPTAQFPTRKLLSVKKKLLQRSGKATNCQEDCESVNECE